MVCPWNSLGKNTGVGCHSLLQGIFPTQGMNPGLLHWGQIFFYHLSHQGSPDNNLLEGHIELTERCSFSGLLQKGSSWKLATGDFPGGLVVGNLPAKAGDTGSINPGPGIFQVLLCNHAMHHNYWIRALGPMNNCWSLRTLEPVLCDKRRLCTAKPVHHNWRVCN